MAQRHVGRAHQDLDVLRRRIDDLAARLTQVRDLIPAIVALLSAAINRAIQAPEVREAMLSAGNEVVSGSQKEFADLVRKDVDRWGAVISRAGIKVQ